MSFNSTEHFVFVPSSPKDGMLYELEPCSTFKLNSFVLLPYKNPQVTKPKALFFEVKNARPVDTSVLEKSKSDSEPLALKATTSKKEYIQKVVQLKEQIQQGNIYEINYCIEFFAENVEINPLTVFMKLHEVAKAPYATLFKNGEDYIISASPELFLKKEGEHLSTKPIKGTIRRGKTAEEDESLKNELHLNIKERTENVMAVDVARNDLSVVAKKGTVQVNKLYNIETFETVHQMVSTVSCEMKDNTSFNDIISATFPMASMTGAPKLKAMELIDAFEDFERGSYSGAMGFIDEKGDYTLSVIIRSIFYNQRTKKLSMAVGGAITYLSEAEQEYEECLLKAKALLKVLNAEII